MYLILLSYKFIAINCCLWRWKHITIGKKVQWPKSKRNYVLLWNLYVNRPKSRPSTCKSTKQSFPLTVTFQNLNKFLTLTNYIHSEESSMQSDSSLDGWHTYSFYEARDFIFRICKLSPMDTTRRGRIHLPPAQANFITFIFRYLT